mmetsp:Transcript_13914/g.40603  ORF Transcript_13914/g.40603 Transcript_13914/m.40603 type:complete len:343 (+) Transcript_13914:138-1166(+)
MQLRGSLCQHRNCMPHPLLAPSRRRANVKIRQLLQPFEAQLPDPLSLRQVGSRWPREDHRLPGLLAGHHRHAAVDAARRHGRWHLVDVLHRRGRASVGPRHCHGHGLRGLRLGEGCRWHGHAGHRHGHGRRGEPYGHLRGRRREGPRWADRDEAARAGAEGRRGHGGAGHRDGAASAVADGRSDGHGRCNGQRAEVHRWGGLQRLRRRVRHERRRVLRDMHLFLHVDRVVGRLGLLAFLVLFALLVLLPRSLAHVEQQRADGQDPREDQADAPPGQAAGPRRCPARPGTGPRAAAAELVSPCGSRRTGCPAPRWGPGRSSSAGGAPLERSAQCPKCRWYAGR